MATLDVGMTRDKVPVTAFGDSNKRVVVGLGDFAASFRGFWDDAVDKLFDVVDAGNPVNCYFYPDAANAPTQYWWGSCYVEASWASGAEAAVSLSGSVSAAGNIVRAGLP
jgi:hypothetical protein